MGYVMILFSGFVFRCVELSTWSFKSSSGYGVVFARGLFLSAWSTSLCACRRSERLMGGLGCRLFSLVDSDELDWLVRG